MRIKSFLLCSLVLSQIVAVDEPEEEMMKTTYYVVQSFQLGTKGVPFADQPFECQSEGQARHKARMLAEEKVAVIAFSRAGDPSTGDYDDAVVLAQYGELPEFADEMLVA